MPDPQKNDPVDLDLEREIRDALGDSSLLGIESRKTPTGGPQIPVTPLGADPEPNSFADATVAGVGGEDVFIEFGGPRVQGVVPADQFGAPPEIGETVRVFVERLDTKEGIYLCGLKRALHAASGWDTVEPGSVVNGTVRAVNKGGLEVQVGHLSGFLPASHASLERIEDLSVLIGDTFPVEVIESDPDRRRLVVSRRAVLARQRDEKAETTLETLAEGDVVRGTVTRVQPFGAFVDIGGVDGLVHVSQMDWKRVNDPADVVQVGDVVEVQILKIDLAENRIGLGMKQLKEDPWLRVTRDHPAGSVLEGTVTRTASYGAFIEIAEGVEGLAHVSELAPNPITSPRDVVRPGDRVTVRVASVDPERRRVSLSLLSERGDRLTDDVADDQTIREVMDRTSDTGPEPTLGDLLKKALGDADPS